MNRQITGTLHMQTVGSNPPVKYMNKKLNIDELIDSIENDSDSSVEKKAAALLITAMKDWPSFGQTDLLEFIKEFKDYYGDNVTAEKLKNCTSGEAWKEEAKSSIIEMLELDISKDFDKVIDEILNKYSKK